MRSIYCESELTKTINFVPDPVQCTIILVGLPEISRGTLLMRATPAYLPTISK